MTDEEARKEAIYLLSSAAQKGGDAPTPAESAVRGSLQGATSGWGDEAAARIDQGVSKIPGLRNIIPQDPRFPALSDPSVTYEQRRDAYRAANAQAAAANPKTYRGNELLGGAVQTAALAAVPGAAGALARPAGAVTGALAGGTLGAVAGAGYSDADTPGGVAKDAAKGAGIGAVTGAAGGYLANKVPKPGTDTQRLGDMARGKLKTEIAERRDAIGAVTKEYPEVRAAFGKPEQLMSAAEAPLSELNTARTSIYNAADSAALAKSRASLASEVGASLPKSYATPSELYGSRGQPGASPGIDQGGAMTPSEAMAPRQNAVKAVTGMDPDAIARLASRGAPMGGTPVTGIRDKITALEGLAAKAQGTSGVEVPAVKKLAASFDALTEGKDVVPSLKLRAWMTDYLGPSKLPVSDSSVEVAKSEIYRIAKDELHQHVADQLGPKALAELEKTNKLISGLTAIKDIARAAGGREITSTPAAQTESEKIGSALAGSRLAKPAYLAGKAAGTAAGQTAKPLTDLAAQHRTHLDSIADAASKGDTETVSKTLYQTIFGP